MKTHEIIQSDYHAIAEKIAGSGRDEGFVSHVTGWGLIEVSFGYWFENVKKRQADYDSEPEYYGGEFYMGLTVEMYDTEGNIIAPYFDQSQINDLVEKLLK